LAGAGKVIRPHRFDDGVQILENKSMPQKGIEKPMGIDWGLGLINSS
jgi:hypothetical protein